MILGMIVIAVVGSALTGCGQDDPSSGRKSVGGTLPPEPLVIAPPPTPTSVLAEERSQRFETELGGSQTTYVPKFQRGQLIEITEERATRGDLARARYEFQGARLLRYSGASLDGASLDGASRDPNEQLEIEFNLQGAVISARRGAKPAPQEDIAQVRAHAQLLRSHALAQQATRTHNLATSH
jgi:hypothetical protein